MASKNSSLVDEWLEDDKLMLIEAWARDCTKKEVAERIGIACSTLKYWEDNYPEIKRALSAGKEIVDYKVENALLKRALGYTTQEIEVTIGKQIKAGEVFMITKKTTTKEVAPDVTACLAWLNNRRPDKWKRNRDREIELDDEDNNIQITILRGPKNEDEDDNVNRSVKLEKKKEDKQEPQPTDEKHVAQKESEDPDYWPDDWEDENDE